MNLDTMTLAELEALAALVDELRAEKRSRSAT